MVDDFNIPELKPLKDGFIKGAYFIFGHTQMQKRFEMGYQSPWALKYFKDRKSKNEFYTSSGRLISPSGKAFADCEGINTDMAPEEVLANLNFDEE